MAAALVFLTWAFLSQLGAAAEAMESTSDRIIEMSVHYNSSRNYLIVGETTSNDFIHCCALGSSGYIQLGLDRTKLGGNSVVIGPSGNTNPDFHFNSAGCPNGFSVNFSISNVKESYDGIYTCQLLTSSSAFLAQNSTFVPVYSMLLLYISVVVVCGTHVLHC